MTLPHVQAARGRQARAPHGAPFLPAEQVISLSPKADAWVCSEGRTYLVEAARLCQAPMLRLAEQYDGLPRPSAGELEAARRQTRAQRLLPRVPVEAVLAALHGIYVVPDDPADAAGILRVIDYVAPGAEEPPLRALAGSCVRRLARAGCSLPPGYESLLPSQR